MIIFVVAIVIRLRTQFYFRRSYACWKIENKTKPIVWYYNGVDFNLAV